MATITNFDIPTLTFTWGTNYETRKINFRFLQQKPKIMHSCPKTNTYVLDPSVFHNDDKYTLLTDDETELLWDLNCLQDTPLPFGQIVFLSYYKNGKFYFEAETDKFKPHLVEQAFRSFGYTEVKISGSYVYVSGKDIFKLKLKYGI